MVSKGIESYLMFDDFYSCSALRQEFTTTFSRFVRQLFLWLFLCKHLIYSQVYLSGAVYIISSTPTSQIANDPFVKGLNTRANVFFVIVSHLVSDQLCL